MTKLGHERYSLYGVGFHHPESLFSKITMNCTTKLRNALGFYFPVSVRRIQGWSGVECGEEGWWGTGPMELI